MIRPRILSSITFFVLLAACPPYSFAQAITQTFAPDSARAKRFGYVIGATLIYSLGDYVAFNELKKNNNPDHFIVPEWYPISKSIVQAGITYFLYKVVGLNSAISFNLIWWTWGDDFAYYGWGQLLSWFPWESRAQSGLRFNSYNSAGWTPIGLLRTQGSAIAKSTLIAQSAVGLTMSIPILW